MIREEMIVEFRGNSDSLVESSFSRRKTTVDSHGQARGDHAASTASVRGRLHPALPVEGATQAPIIDQKRRVSPFTHSNVSMIGSPTEALSSCCALPR